MHSRRVQWLKAATHLGGLLPLAVLILLYAQNRLGPVPIAAVIRRTGRYGLAFLILSLVPTVVRTVTGYSELLHVRRWLGLYAFLYAALHFLAFAGLDYGFSFGLIAQAIREGRREIAGAAALVILGVLAVTSIRSLMARLGKHWKRLHRGAYLAAALVVLHYLWNYKELRAWPILSGFALLLLLAARLPPVADRLRRLRGTRP